MEVLLFGVTKDIIGSALLNVPETAAQRISNVGHLKAYLLELYPQLSGVASLAVAVNSEYAADDIKIHRTDEIALIPPVSGG